MTRRQLEKMSGMGLVPAGGAGSMIDARSTIEKRWGPGGYRMVLAAGGWWKVFVGSEIVMLMSRSPGGGVDMWDRDTDDPDSLTS